MSKSWTPEWVSTVRKTALAGDAVPIIFLNCPKHFWRDAKVRKRPANIDAVVYSAKN